jgi:hypothetical protein
MKDLFADGDVQCQFEMGENDGIKGRDLGMSDKITGGMDFGLELWSCGVSQRFEIGDATRT